MDTYTVFILIALMATLGSPQSTSVCPPGPDKNTYLQVHGNFCYQFVVYRKYTHSEAKGDCEINGGSLVLVKTADIQNYVYHELSTTYRDTYDKVWIGLNDLAQEDHYEWEDGTKLGFYSNWYHGEGPGSTTANHNFTHITRDCVIMDVSPSVGGKWREVSCESTAAFLLFSGRETHSYVCQYEIVTTTLPPATDQTTTLPPATDQTTTLQPITTQTTTTPVA